MKKNISALFILCAVLMIFSGCGSKNGSRDARAEAAIKALDEQWEDYQIKNTRIIELKENDIPMFQDIDCIVEFILFTNYYGASPYYGNAGIYDTVSIYKDGSMVVNERNLFSLYLSRTFNTDFSGIIENIKDLGSTYDN